jgi:hypothetical protein
MAKKRNKEKAANSFPVVPVAISISAVVITAVVAVVVVINSKSKKETTETATNNTDSSNTAPKFEPPTLRPKSPNDKGSFPQFGQNIPQTNPKPKTPTEPVETAPKTDPWANDVLVQLNRNSEKFIGQTLTFESHMAQSIKGTKENPQYGIIHIGTGAWSDDKIYFTSSQALFMKMANSKDPALSNFQRVRLTMKVEDRMMDKLRVVTIAKFEFLNAGGQVLLTLE